MTAPAAATSPRAKILIVDDDGELRDLLLYHMRLAGHDCATATDGVEGLAALCADDFDVLLTDLEMPVMNGMELLAAMKEAEIDTAAIVLTGHGDISRAVEAMKLGAFDFLSKPIVADELVHVVSRALEYERVRRHGHAMERLAAEWQSTFDACPDLLAVTDASQRILRCNQALVERLRVNKDEVVGRSLNDLLDGGVDSPGAAACRATLADGSVQTCEVRDGRLGGDLLVTTAPIRRSKTDLLGVVFLARDITARKRAETALRRYAEQLEVFREIDQAVLSVRVPEVLIRSALPHLRKLVPCDHAFVFFVDLEKSEGRVVAACGDGALGPAEDDRLLLEQFVPLIRFQEDTRLVVDDLDALSPIPEALRGFRSLLALSLLDESGFVGRVMFLSERVGAFPAAVQELATKVVGHLAVALHHAWLFEQVRAGREGLQALSHRLVEAHEVERRQIARELHDEIGQQLTGLKLMLEIAAQLPAATASARLQEAMTLINELMERVRALSLDLRPAMLDDLGLLPALLWFFDRYSAQTGVRVAFDHQGLEERFMPAVETAAYRIVQESLTNVARYAGVQSARVRIWTRQDVLTVQVQDQGKGFDAAAALHAASSNGLTGMCERAKLLGGKLTVESAPLRGTQITAELPSKERLQP